MKHLIAKYRTLAVAATSCAATVLSLPAYSQQIKLKGGAKEERQVDIVDLAAEQAAEMERQTEMKSFLSGAIDLFWRLCFDMTGNPPEAVLQAKLDRLPQEFPSITFDTEVKKKAGPKKGPKAKKVAAEPVPA